MAAALASPCRNRIILTGDLAVMLTAAGSERIFVVPAGILKQKRYLIHSENIKTGKSKAVVRVEDVNFELQSYDKGS